MKKASSSTTAISTLRIDDVEYVRKDSVRAAPPPAGPEVLVRTRSAGVHLGTLKSRNGQEVTLTDARRLWSWSGAFTLSAVATTGVNRSKSRISVPVSEILLLDAIEIIPISSGVDLSTTEK